MYSLDINFLRDREPVIPPPQARGDVITDRKALVAGVAAGVFPLAVVGGLWFFAQMENGKLAEELAELERQIATLSSQEQQVKALQAEAAQIKAQTQGVASIFDTSLKPIVVILQDIRDRVPTGVQINQIDQTITADPEAMKAAAAAPAPAPAPAQTPPPAPAAGATPPPSPPPGGQTAAAPPPASPPVPWTGFQQKLKIVGTARAFDDVNDFILSLKQSDFLDSNAIKLTKSELKENPLLQSVVLADEFKNQRQNQGILLLNFPDVVAYEIEVDVNKKLASEVTPQIRSKGAIGLATRIETLKQKGVMQP